MVMGVKGDLKEEIFNVVNENVKALERLFPSAVKDGQVDFEALKEELGQFEEVGPEKYGLTWSGKQNAKKISQQDISGKTLKYIPEDSKNPDTTENLYIEGDNLEVLKLLRQNYYGAIKMIYIDPPYNTGNDFIYKDDFSMDKSQSDIEEGEVSELGERYIVNLDSSNRFHANWSNMMYPRLKVAKDLLTNDGVIFISIDNNEISNIKFICDEIFGEGAFVTIIHVQMSTVQGQKVKAAKQGNIVKNAEYILVYSKSGSKNIGKRPLLDSVKYDNHYNLLLKKESDNRYSQVRLVDVVKKNKTLMSELKLLGLINENTSLISQNRLQDYYEYSPMFKEFIHENSEMIVRSHDSVDVNNEFKDKMEVGYIYNYSAENREYLVCKGNDNKVSQRICIADKIKRADDFYSTVGPTTIRGDWWAGFYLDMGNVSKEGDVNYDNGKKPVRLIKQLLEFCTEEGDIILDFFSGSATTAHAIMQLAIEEKINRKYILIQIDENLDKSFINATGDTKKSIRKMIDLLDQLQKPHKLSEIGKERIRRAGEKIKEENKYKEGIDNLDIGFKVFRVSDTNIKWNYENENLKTLSKISVNNNEEQTTFDYIAATKMGLDLDEVISSKDILDFMSGTKDIDVVYEILLRQRDIPLSAKVELLDDIGNRTYIFADSYLVCLETEITEELIEKLADINPLPIKYILRDSAFGDDIELKDESYRRLQALIERNTGESKKAYTVEFI